MYDDDIQTMGLATVGAARVPARILSRLAAASAAPRPQWLGTTTEQGVSLPQEELDVLPFVASNALDENATNCSLTGYPQRPFRGERLVITATDQTGADRLAGLVIDPAIYVGASQVGASQGAMSAQAFTFNAFGVRLSMPSAGQGTRVYIPLRLLYTPAQGDTISVSATLFGRAVR